MKKVVLLVMVLVVGLVLGLGSAQVPGTPQFPNRPPPFPDDLHPDWPPNAECQKQWENGDLCITGPIYPVKLCDFLKQLDSTTRCPQKLVRSGDLTSVKFSTISLLDKDLSTNLLVTIQELNSKKDYEAWSKNRGLKIPLVGIYSHPSGKDGDYILLFFDSKAIKKGIMLISNKGVISISEFQR